MSRTRRKLALHHSHTHKWYQNVFNLSDYHLAEQFHQGMQPSNFQKPPRKHRYVRSWCLSRNYNGIEEYGLHYGLNPAYAISNEESEERSRIDKIIRVHTEIYRNGSCRRQRMAGTRQTKRINHRSERTESKRELMKAIYELE